MYLRTHYNEQALYFFLHAAGYEQEIHYIIIAIHAHAYDSRKSCPHATEYKFLQEQRPKRDR